MNSLGVFHHSLSVSLASFAKRVSAGDHDRRPGQDSAVLIPHSPASRKAGYGCTQRYAPEGTMHRIAGSSSASYMDPLTTMGVRPRTRTGLHGNRVGVSMPLEIALSPQARKRASSQHPPKTGRLKQTPEVSQVCPLEAF